MSTSSRVSYTTVRGGGYLEGVSNVFLSLLITKKGEGIETTVEICVGGVYQSPRVARNTPASLFFLLILPPPKPTLGKPAVSSGRVGPAETNCFCAAGVTSCSAIVGKVVWCGGGVEIDSEREVEFECLDDFDL